MCPAHPTPASGVVALIVLTVVGIGAAAAMDFCATTTTTMVRPFEKLPIRPHGAPERTQQFIWRRGTLPYSSGGGDLNLGYR